MASSSSRPRRSRRTRVDRPSRRFHPVLVPGVYRTLVSRCPDCRGEHRAAAFTALRCGLRPRCVDCFADRDLAAVCPVERVEPENVYLGFERFFTTSSHSLHRGPMETSPWFYTGGLENHPALVERISRRHHLWGVGDEVLSAVRNPIAVVQALNEVGIPAPEVSPRSLRASPGWELARQAAGLGRRAWYRAAIGSIDIQLRFGLLPKAHRWAELLGPVHRPGGLSTIDRNHKPVDWNTGCPIRLPGKYRSVPDLSRSG